MDSYEKGRVGRKEPWYRVHTCAKCYVYVVDVVVQMEADGVRV